MDDFVSRQAAITTAEEYRQRMIQAFHNADCDELIAVVCLPTEKEFEHLEWLLKTHYKKEPCEDTVSRQSAIDAVEHITSSMSVCVNTDECHGMKRMQRQAVIELANLPSAQPTIKPERKTGIWIERGLSGMVCSSCGYEYECKGTDSEDYCPHCGSYNGGEGNE